MYFMQAFQLFCVVKSDTHFHQNLILTLKNLKIESAEQEFYDSKRMTFDR